MTDSFSRPFRPIEMSPSTLESFQLADMASQLKLETPFTQSGRNSLSLVRGDDFTMVLAVLRKGTKMREHKAPGAATVVLLEGAIDFEDPGAGKMLRLHPKDSVVFSADLVHSLVALEDSAYLIVIGGRLDSD